MQHYVIASSRQSGWWRGRVSERMSDTTLHPCQILGNTKFIVAGGALSCGFGLYLYMDPAVTGTSLPVITTCVVAGKA